MSDRRQQRKELRAAKKEAEKKKEARRELGRRLLTAFGFGALVVGFFALTAIFDGDGALPSGYELFRSQPTACGAEAPPEENVVQFEAPEDQADLEGASEVVATIETSCGPIVIDLNLDYPETVNSFVFLAREGFYDGQAIHRILEGFDIQGGDPSADGTGGPGYTISDEYPPENYEYEEGDVFMANRGRGTTGSQFRIALRELAILNPSFNLLGHVISGQETLERMTEIDTALSPGTRESSLPLETVYIESVTIEVTGS
ncbi:MAG: peptidylprolyl isomerase [Actinobacteria bacterium]|nr:MAG: peptidylprolyl isomerase [Actinomycetota bacterium]REK38746.1 MAG: peptidylprolyl isomerase [Actinomycetota bacterium]